MFNLFKSIDYFGAFQNFSIPKEHVNKPWYANHYHFDKPNSKNMLKVFIPMADIGMNDGPLELIDINKKTIFGWKFRGYFFMQIEHLLT